VLQKLHGTSYIMHKFTSFTLSKQIVYCVTKNTLNKLYSMIQKLLQKLQKLHSTDDIMWYKIYIEPNASCITKTIMNRLYHALKKLH